MCFGALHGGAHRRYLRPRRCAAAGAARPWLAPVCLRRDALHRQGGGGQCGARSRALALQGGAHALSSAHSLPPGSRQRHRYSHARALQPCGGPRAGGRAGEATALRLDSSQRWPAAGERQHDGSNARMRVEGLPGCQERPARCQQMVLTWRHRCSAVGRGRGKAEPAGPEDSNRRREQIHRVLEGQAPAVATLTARQLRALCSGGGGSGGGGAASERRGRRRRSWLHAWCNTVHEFSVFEHATTTNCNNNEVEAAAADGWRRGQRRPP